ncbi:serine/threonine-protein kinase [Planctomyces sp. SH-PL14]|uniref:serine/threonine-protein kinase n=1 Tax=Planctomyces sp. SH-PL14 TaxID=1632864 RepID=UPI00078C5E8A|nr:serine/threonine-protein kinase [Planctomyces sp. SH-PL14]AMV19332.1 Serine/threonine-protein kinase PknB [Planctomyces sp. SH-PL14]
MTRPSTDPTDSDPTPPRIDTSETVAEPRAEPKKPAAKPPASGTGPSRGGSATRPDTPRPPATTPVDDSHLKTIIAPKVVERIGDFEILGEIARGGMGVVYRARQLGVNRTVALKMMLGTHGMSPEERGRFQAEAEAAGQLDHPHIVAVHAVGEDRGRPYLSMAYVEGNSLKQIVADGPLGPRKAATLMEKIARAVHYAHSKGIVHRDIKPANVLIDKDGEPRVTDFGLAKRTAKDSGLTATGQVLGTPSYMPPEQASGKTEEVGVLSDVYSLGATLYCLLAGRPPFQAASVIETLQQVVHTDPVAPRQWSPQLPRDLETICLKTLSKSPKDRYASGAEMADELQRFLNGEPILARPLGRLERTARWMRRRPTEAGLAVVSVLALVALAVVGVSLSYQSDLSKSLSETEHQREVAETQRTEAQRQRVLAEEEKAKADGLRGEAEQLRRKAEVERTAAVAAREEADRQRTRAEYQEARARRFLYGSQINVAMQMWEEANHKEMTRILDGLRPAGGSEDLRGFEWHYLDRLRRAGFDYAQLPTHQGLLSLSVTSDGRRLATSGRSTIRVFDLERRETVWEQETPLRSTVVRWGGGKEEGRLFVGYQDGRIALLDAAGKTIRKSDGPVANAAVGPLALTRDDSRIAAVFANGQVAVLNVDTFQRVARWQVPKANAQSGVEFSHDDKRVMTTLSFGDRVQSWNAETGKPEADLEGLFDGMGVIRRDPGGDWLVGAAGSLLSIVQWDLRTGKKVRQFLGHERRVEDVAMTANVEKILSASDDATVRFWTPGLSDQSRVLRGHAGPVHFAAMNLDGQRLVTGSSRGDILEWNISADPLCHRLRGHDGWVFRVAFSPDGETVATASRDKTVRTWNVRTGALLRTFKGHTEQTEGVVFSHDGTTLYSSSDDTTIRAWSLQQPDSPPAIWKGHTAPIWGLALSPDGKHLASAGHDQTVRVWETATGRCVRTWKGHTRRVMDVAWHPRDRSVLSAGEDGTVRCWSFDSDSQQWVHPVTGTNDVAISLAGDLMATSSVGVVQVWAMPERTLKFELRGATNTAYQVEFSPDGTRLATGGADGSARVWDMATGQQLLRFKHESTVFGVTFSRDGRRLGTASRDESVRIFDSLDP